MKPNFLLKKTLTVLMFVFLIPKLYAGPLSVSIYTYGNQQACGTSVYLEADAAGQNGYINYVWKLSNGTIIRTNKNSLGNDYFDAKFDSTTTYQVFLTDSAGQAANASVKINLTWGYLSYYKNKNDICIGESFRSSIYPTNLKSYTWTFDDATIINGNTSVTKSFATAGKHALALEVKNVCGLDTVIHDTVNVNTNNHLPTLNAITGLHYICPGDNLSFNIDYGGYDTTHIMSFKWDLGDGTTSTFANINKHVYKTVGDYNISVVVSDYCGHKDTLKTVAHVKGNLVIPGIAYNVGNPILIGNNYSYSYYIPGDTMSIASQKWMFGDGDSSSMVSPYHIYTTCTQETLKVIATNYCGYTQAGIYTFVAPIDYYSEYASAYVSPNISKGCTGEMIQFSLNLSYISPKNYQWDFGDGTTVTSNSTVMSHSYSSPGTYSVSVTINGLCSYTTTANTSVTIGASTSFADAYVSIDTYGMAECLNDISYFGVSSSFTLKNYLWSFDDGSKINGSTANHIFKTAGKHTFKLQLTDYCGFDTTLYDTITISSKKGYFPGNLTIRLNNSCPNSDVLASIYGGGYEMSGNFEINKIIWNFGDGYKSTSYQNGFTHKYKSTGQYLVSAEITNGCGTDTTLNDSILISNNLHVGSIYVNINNTVCPGQISEFGASSSSATSYKWNFGDGTAAITTVNDTISHAFTKAGSYTVTVTATNGCGYDTSISNYIEVSNKASYNSYNFNMGYAQLSCVNDSMTWNVDKAVTYSWNFGDGHTLDSIFKYKGQSYMKHKYAASGTYNVQLVETDYCGLSHTFNDQITISSSPGIAQGANAIVSSELNDSICANRDAYFTYSSLEPINIVNFGDGSLLYSGKNPVDKFKHRYSTAGNYELKLSQINSCGDSVITSTLISVKTCYLPLDANFTNNISKNNVSFKGSNSATTWLWNFGDNTVITGHYAIHTYNKIGSYNVCLSTGDTQGDTATYCQTVKIDTVVCNAVARFTSYTSNINTNTQAFTDSSKGNISNWYWDFGDGTISTLQNPTHNYQNAGNYTVQLSVSDNHTECSSTFSSNVVVGNVICAAGFSYAVLAQTVSYSNTSQGTLTTYYWDFGDGNYSTAKNPVHTYVNPGAYQVSLTVANSDNSCMDQNTTLVNVGVVGCDAEFSYYVDSAKNTVYLKERTLSNVTDEMWTFGDGKVTNAISPSHSFAKPGFYTVSLSVYNTNSQCLDYIEKEITVNGQGADCKADFIYTVDSASRKVVLTDKSVGDIKTYVWNLGDNTINSKQTVKNLNYTYAAPGYYNVCHLVVNKKGNSDITCKTIGVAITSTKGGCLANFNFNVNSATKTGYFKDASLGHPDTWVWNFGDGNTSASQSPSHTFSGTGKSPGSSKAGYYLVSLTSTNSATKCTDKVYKLINTSMSLADLVAGFGFDVKKTGTKAENYPVDFTGTGVGDHARLRWSFGDSTIDTTTTSPVHTYTNTGSYSVCYQISDPNTGVVDSVCQQVQVTASDITALDNTINDLAIYPIPVNEKTTIAFTLNEQANVSIVLVDISGRQVLTIFNERKGPGVYSFNWNASGIEKGSYILQLRTSSGASISKMLVKQ